MRVSPSHTVPPVTGATPATPKCGRTGTRMFFSTPWFSFTVEWSTMTPG